MESGSCCHVYTAAMHDIQIFQIGVGGVGQALINLVQASAPRWAAAEGITVRYAGLADSHGALTGDLDDDAIGAALRRKADGEPLGRAGDWAAALPAQPAIIVDLSGSDATAPQLVAALERGHRVVLANKKPLAGPLATFEALTAGRRTRYEATVGAGLPVIATLQALLDTGDTVAEIAGCFSGTLGYVLSEVERGTRFSAAVATAKARGWTEPDPRDDLGGVDVARKALILARTMGQPLELSDIPVEPLFGAEHAALSPAEFMAALPALDDDYGARFAAALDRGNTLRYVATVTAAGAQVGLREVPRSSPLGSLSGPDNFVSLTTTFYPAQPLILRGPGAGTIPTASGVLGDILALARQR